MNKTKKLLSVLLAVVMALSCMSVMASAAKTNYKTVDELTALGAYSPYGQVTRLSTEERTSIVFDFLDNILAKANINMGKVFDVLGLSVTINLTSVDNICYSLDTIKSTFTNTLATIAMGIVNLGILESLEPDSWQTGMSRDSTDQFTILTEILELLSANTTLVGKVFTDGLDLGIVSLGDMSAIEDVIGDLPGLIKGLVFPLIERWDDTLSLVQTYDTRSKGNGNVTNTVNDRVKKLFSDDMSITTIKYDVNGNMTSEHTRWKSFATGPAAPAAPTADSPRCYYQFSSTTPGSVMTVYHIVDAAEAKALAKTPDEINGSPAAYTYFKEKQTFVMTQEVEGSDTYVWRATDEWDNSWSLKWYNDDSQLLPDFSGDEIDLTTMSAGELLYKFIPVLFKDMAPVVLNGSVKKILAEFFGAKFTYVGDVGSDEVEALPNSTNAFFTEEAGDYMFEWSDYAIIGGTHYWRFEDQIWVGDISAKNNYFDIIDWDYEIKGDFMNEFIPEGDDDASDRLLLNLNDFLVKVATTITKPSAETADTQSDYTKTWTRPTFKTGSNAYAVENIKAAAQAVISLAPQHIFGSDYATNERCYYDLLMSSDNDTVLTGIAAMLVDIIMPSMSLPGKSDILASGAKVGAILAAVIREFAAYLAPEYNFDALIYTDFGATDGVKNFVTGKDSEYWFDVCMTMGINVGFEYLRAFADMGEGTTEWNAFVAATGYKVDGGNYTEADMALDGLGDTTVNQWEGMLDYIVDWALEKDYEWTWKMENLVEVDGLDINLSTVQNPFNKIDKILFGLIPFDEILDIKDYSGYRSGTRFEKFLRYDLILGIVDLRWDKLVDTIAFPATDANYFRNGGVLGNLATLLKRIVNGIFDKVGTVDGKAFALIPSAITNFDNLANQTNIKDLVVNLVGVLKAALVDNGLAATVFPFLNFLFGWKTDPQKIADPQIWTSFRDGNDYAFQWTGNGVYPTMDADNTIIKVLNNSAGMLETHRKSDVTDHAYDIQIKSVTSDATVNDLKFTYGDGNGLVSPYETLDIKIGGTYNGEEAATITIAYDYVGKDGQPIGGTQYTSLTILFSNQYEDANVDGRWSGDDDDDYTGTNQYKKFVFTEDLYTSVTTYEPTIFYVKPSVNLGATSKSFTQICANGEQQDCNGNITKAGDVPTGQSTDYFEWIRDKNEAGWEDSISDGKPASGRLYKAKSGVTAETEFPYGSYDMGNMAVQYGGAIVFEVNFIYYNDYDLGDIYLENKDNGYNAYQGVAEDIYNEYNEAWKTIVYGATYPMMTEMNGNAATDYVATIQPHIPAAIERFEAAKKAYEEALADAQASGSGAALPAYIQTLQAEIDNDFVNGKEINFQDYAFYEYFNYNDVKVAAENLYRTYLQPEVMDTYYIQGSGIREAELKLVAGAETNTAKKAGILASRLENNADAIAASQVAHDEWKMPVTTKLIADDFTSRLGFYKQFLEGNAEPMSYNGKAAHMYFLEKEIAFVEAQGLLAEDYEAVTWGRYADALADAKAVAAGEDEFSSFNSRIYDVKYNLMVAYKQLLKADDSLIAAGGTADLLANIEIANAIFASMDAADGAYTLKEGVDADKAYAALISALGYEYQARYSENDVEVQNGTKNAGDLKYNDDGSAMKFDLYADSALEYANNDRPNKTGNQAKVNAANAKLEAAIANFEKAAVEAPELGAIDGTTGAFGEVVVDEETGFTTGYLYGVTAGEAADSYFALVDAEAGTVEWSLGSASNVNGTGAIATVKDTKGNAVAEFTLVIFGDVNGDAAVTLTDTASIKLATLGGEIDGDANNMAADVNADGSVTLTDTATVKLATLGGEISNNPYVA